MCLPISFLKIISHHWLYCHCVDSFIAQTFPERLLFAKHSPGHWGYIMKDLWSLLSQNLHSRKKVRQ